MIALLETSKDPKAIAADVAAAWRAPIGAASPLWLMFAGAATAGMAFWWMNRWRIVPTNLEAVLAPELPAPEPAPAAEAAAEAVEELVEAPVVETAAAVEEVVEAAPEPVIETAPEPVLEAAPEPVVEAAPEPAPKPKTAPKAKAKSTDA